MIYGHSVTVGPCCAARHSISRGGAGSSRRWSRLRGRKRRYTKVQRQEVRADFLYQEPIRMISSRVVYGRVSAVLALRIYTISIISRVSTLWL